MPFHHCMAENKISSCYSLDRQPFFASWVLQLLVLPIVINHDTACYSQKKITFSKEALKLPLWRWRFQFVKVSCWGQSHKAIFSSILGTIYNLRVQTRHKNLRYDLWVGAMASDQVPLNDKETEKEMVAVWLKPAHWLSSQSSKIPPRRHDLVAVQKKNENDWLTKKHCVSQFLEWFNFFFTIVLAYLSP